MHDARYRVPIRGVLWEFWENENTLGIGLRCYGTGCFGCLRQCDVVVGQCQSFGSSGATQYTTQYNSAVIPTNSTAVAKIIDR